MPICYNSNCVTSSEIKAAKIIQQNSLSLCNHQRYLQIDMFRYCYCMLSSSAVYLERERDIDGKREHNQSF